MSSSPPPTPPVSEDLVAELGRHLQTLLELLKSGSTLDDCSASVLHLHLDELRSLLTDETR